MSSISWDNLSAVVSRVGKPNNNSRYFGGSVAEMAMWDVQLTQGEIDALAKGFSPLMIRPESLIRYHPLIRSTDGIIGGNYSTISGTSVVAHAPVIQRKGRRRSLHVTEAAVVSGSPWYYYAQQKAVTG